MPVYTFEDPKTEEYYELTMTYDEYEVFLKKHPELNQVFRMNIVDPVGIGVTKPPADFQKYVLSRARNMPGAKKDVIEKRWQLAKEI